MKSPTVYFDTSVYVSALLGPAEPGYQESLDALRAAEQGHFVGLISALVPAEILGAPKIRAPQGWPPAEADRRMGIALDYLRANDFRYIEIGKREGIRGAEIAQQWNIKGADALHLAVAEIAGCEQFHTRDQDQLKVGRLANMLIMQPIGMSQAELDFDEPD